MRSKLTEVQRQFESIVHELDGPEFHVLWNSKTIGFPVITNNIDDSKNTYMVDSKNRIKESQEMLLTECDEDRTITQEDCDNLLQNSACVNVDLPLDMDKSVRENLEEKFNRMTDNKEVQHTDVKIQHNPEKEDHPDELQDNSGPSSTSSYKPSESNPNSQSEPTSPRGNNVDVFTQHSTPRVSSHLPEMNEDLRRHPLLTDSWMTDKSFGMTFYIITGILCRL